MQMEMQMKQQRMVADIAAKQDELELGEERLAVQERIAGMQVGAKIATDKANLSAKQQEAGLRMGIEIARESANEERSKQQQTPLKPEGE